MRNRVRTSIAGGIADVRLIRADKMNALDPPMFEALTQTLAELASTGGLRAVVLSGEGRAFCAGLDMESFRGMSGNGSAGVNTRGLAERTHGIANKFQHIVWGWRELPVPVIAAVHGVAFGGGLQLALGADMRYADKAARFSVRETNWGLIPDMCGTQLMRHLAREDIVRELTYTARIFSAEEALSFGLVTRLVEQPLTEAMTVAHEIAGRSPHAVRAAKRLLNQAGTADPQTGLIAEAKEQEALVGSANQVEAIRSNLDRRAPVFADVLAS
jgi:enoyl-CoA hydratase/carnithine racemase